MWRKAGGAKQPFYFQLRDEGVFAFAGLWDTWRGEGNSVASCAVITTTPNELVGRVHDRMPVILRPGDFDAWLSDESDARELIGLLTPFPAEYMQAYPVGRDVNSPSVDTPQLVARV